MQVKTPKTVEAGAARRNKKRNVKFSATCFAQHFRKLLPAFSQSILVGRVHASCEKRVTAAEMSWGDGHSIPSRQKQHKTADTDAVIKQRATATWEIKGKGHAFGKGVWQKDVAAGELQTFIKIRIAHLGATT